MRTRDQYALDGIIACGERVVRKGGKVFFGGYTATHPALIPWVGKMVFVHVECYYFQNVNISDAEDYCRRICTAPVEHRKLSLANDDVEAPSRKTPNQEQG